jgi:hypothetical protein
MRGPLPVMQDKPAAECSTGKSRKKSTRGKKVFPDRQGNAVSRIFPLQVKGGSVSGR